MRFSTIFAVEYVVTGLAYVAVDARWWPPSLAEVEPPASLPITFAIFGLLVYLISFIPVIGQITRLADPYFLINDRGDLQIGGFDARQVPERRFASALIVALVGINQLQVAINVRLSFFNRDWFNAIQNNDLPKRQRPTSGGELQVAPAGSGAFRAKRAQADAAAQVTVL